MSDLRTFNERFLYPWIAAFLWFLILLSVVYACVLVLFLQIFGSARAIELLEVHWWRVPVVTGIPLQVACMAILHGYRDRQRRTLEARRLRAAEALLTAR